jgi:hypothetical protein
MAAWASSMLVNGSCSLSSSSCRVWCSRSIFPVVVGERGLVSRWVMPFSRQIRSNSTSAGRGLPNRPVNCLPLSESTSPGHPVAAHRFHERQPNRPCGGAQHDGSDHAVPGMLIDPGDHLALTAAGQEQAGTHIQLPQLHRRRTFPPNVLITAPAARDRLDELVTDKHPVNRGPGQAWIPTAVQLEDQAARPPPGVGPAQLANQRLNLRRNPPRMLPGRMRPVSQAIKTIRPVPGKSTMHGLPGDAVSFGDLDDRSPGQDLHNGAVSLLDHVQLPKRMGASRIKWSHRVAHQAEPGTGTGHRDRTPGQDNRAELQLVRTFSTSSRARQRAVGVAPAGRLR